MGLLEQFSSAEDKKDLANEIKPVGKRFKQSQQSGKKSQIQNQKEKEKEVMEKAEEKDSKEIVSDVKSDDLITLLNVLEKNYDASQNISKMFRIQKKNYKNLVKLKADDISTTKFLNFALSYVFASKDFNTIVQHLKKPK